MAMTLLDTLKHLSTDPTLDKVILTKEEIVKLLREIDTVVKISLKKE